MVLFDAFSVELPISPTQLISPKVKEVKSNDLREVWPRHLFIKDVHGTGNPYSFSEKWLFMFTLEIGNSGPEK